jgi:hypothetical protein
MIVGYNASFVEICNTELRCAFWELKKTTLTKHFNNAGRSHIGSRIESNDCFTNINEIKWRLFRIPLRLPEVERGDVGGLVQDRADHGRRPCPSARRATKIRKKGELILLSLTQPVAKNLAVQGRVARWFIFKPKIQIWVKFLGPWNGKCCNVLCPFGILFGHLV